VLTSLKIKKHLTMYELEKFLGSFVFTMVLIVFAIKIIHWLWTAPSEFIKLLRQGPNPKLTFVFIGIGLAVFALLKLRSEHITFEENPQMFFIAIGISAGVAAILYHIFLSTRYQSVGYFFIIIFKILLVIIPTIFLLFITQELVWGLLYFLIMLLITYYSVFSIKTKSENGRTTMVGYGAINISFGKIFKYLIVSIFQSVVGFFVSEFLSNIF